MNSLQDSTCEVPDPWIFWDITCTVADPWIPEILPVQLLIHEFLRYYLYSCWSMNSMRYYLYSCWSMNSWNITCTVADPWIQWDITCRVADPWIPWDITCTVADPWIPWDPLLHVDAVYKLEWHFVSHYLLHQSKPLGVVTLQPVVKE